MSKELELTGEQKKAVEAVMEWLSNPEGGEVFRLFGYAGTGKTTTLRSVLEAIETRMPATRYWLAAPTGKAAHVLSQKTGRKATTLHAPGYIYAPLSRETALTRDPTWVRSSRFEVVPAGYSKLASIDLVIVDEASMVGDEVNNDLFSMRGVIGNPRRKIRVLAVGDPAQLDPVMQGPAYTNLPGDIVLRDVMRQEAGPVLTAATWLRDNERFDRGAPEIQAIDKHSVPIGRMVEADVVIVNSNAVRLELSQQLREHVGKPALTPVAGDTIMFRANQLAANIVNGMVALVGDGIRHSDAIAGHNVFDRVVDSRIVTREGHRMYELTLRDGGLRVLTPTWIFAQPKPYECQMPKITLGPDEVVAPVQFAHVISCHSAQGSEWDDVLIYDADYQWRWMYTAVTRARITVTNVFRIDNEAERVAPGFFDDWLDAVLRSDVKPKVKETGRKLAALGERHLMPGTQQAKKLVMPQPTWHRHRAEFVSLGLIEGYLLTLPS